MALNGRVAVVTGGARGMGRAIVEGFLREGAKVVAIDRSWDDQGEFKAQLDANNDAHILTVDVADEAQIERAFQATMEAFGTVDIVVNNAGYRQRDVVPWMVINALDITPEQWQRAYEVNTMAPLLMVKHFVGPMREKKSGSIVQISSDSGVRGRPGNQPYGATKAALTNLSESLAEELKADNVAVNCVFPAGTMTTGYEEQNRMAAEHLGRPMSRNIPYKPESVVPLVLFLAQQDVRVTGRTFPLVDWNLEHGMGGIETWAAKELTPGVAAPEYQHPKFLR